MPMAAVAIRTFPLARSTADRRNTAVRLSALMVQTFPPKCMVPQLAKKASTVAEVRNQSPSSVSINVKR